MILAQQLFVKNNPWALPAALREAYFGTMLSTIPASVPGAKHLARFIDAFGTKQKFSVVSMFEGISLHAALHESDSSEIEHHWWKWLKTTSEGNGALREIMKQLISGLALLHSLNITHRDLKPDNIVLCFYTSNGNCIAKPTIGSAYHGLHVRLIDFGSGLDDYSSKYLYGDDGPTRGTQDVRYMSPECYFPLDPQACLRKGTETLARYDMFSIGITYLEIILMTELVLPNHGRGRFLDVCVGKTDLPAHCRSEKSFLNYIKERDPLKIGFPGIQGLRFAQQLLNVDIGKRLTAEKALKHPYLHSGVLVSRTI